MLRFILTLSSFSNVLKSMLIRDSFSLSLLSFSFSPIMSELNVNDFSLPVRPSRPLLHCLTLTSALLVLLMLSVLSVRTNPLPSVPFNPLGDAVPDPGFEPSPIPPGFRRRETDGGRVGDSCRAIKYASSRGGMLSITVQAIHSGLVHEGRE